MADADSAACLSAVTVVAPGALPGRVGRAVGTPAGRAVLSARGLLQAVCPARSLIPRSIFWVITKLTASTGSTMNRAQGRV